MLGFIKIYKPELRIKEYDMYKAVYCSLCKRTGKLYGLFTRFTLSYDFTFLALLQMSLSENCGRIEKGRCCCNPVKRCNYCVGSDEALDFAAAASIVMIYYHMLDNVADESGIKRAAYRVLARLFSRAHRKAADGYPAVEKAVCEYVAAQARAEQTAAADLDAAAAPTAKVLSEIFSMCAQDGDSRALSRLGFCIGRFIYIADALQDKAEDERKNRYNPLLGDNSMEKAVRNLYFCINESVNAFELINIRQYKNILGNIIYMGLENTLKGLVTDKKEHRK